MGLLSSQRMRKANQRGFHCPWADVPQCSGGLTVRSDRNVLISLDPCADTMAKLFHACSDPPQLSSVSRDLVVDQFLLRRARFVDRGLRGLRGS